VTCIGMRVPPISTNLSRTSSAATRPSSAHSVDEFLLYSSARLTYGVMQRYHECRPTDPDRSGSLGSTRDHSRSLEIARDHWRSSEIHSGSLGTGRPSSGFGSGRGWVGRVSSGWTVSWLQAQFHMAPFRMAPFHMAPFHMAPFHMAPFRMAPFHMAPFHMAPFRMAPFRMAPFHMAPFRMAPFHMAPFRMAPFRMAPFRVARLRMAQFRVWRTSRQGCRPTDVSWRIRSADADRTTLSVIRFGIPLMTLLTSSRDSKSRISHQTSSSSSSSCGQQSVAQLNDGAQCYNGALDLRLAAKTD
jgi:hypothetical protein